MQRDSASFFAAIIGGGLAGLTCGVLLSKAGYKVVLLEKNYRLGGYAVSYTKSGHRFDIAIQAIGGCDPDGAVRELLVDIQREDKVTFLPCEPARVYFFNDKAPPWRQSGSWLITLASLGDRYPEHRENIKECYTMWHGILQELQHIASDTSEFTPFRFSSTYPLLARYGKYTLKEFLDEKGLPDALQELLTARSGYCMLPAERLSVVGFACTEMTYRNGAWLVKGGIERLTRTLARSLTDFGGIIERKAKVVSIITHKGAVKGIKTEDGRKFQSKYVIIASAAGPALQNILDRPELLPNRYMNRLNSMKATGSYYISYYHVPRQAVEGLWPNMEIKNIKGVIYKDWSPKAYYVLIPSLVDATAAPGGSHCFCLSIPCPPGMILGNNGRQRCRAFLENIVQERFARLKGQLNFLFDLAPEQLAATTGNPDGCAYGWAQTPEQSGIKRLNLKTPIPGLYLAGHWTMPGGGIAGVITSGRLCAEAILRNPEQS
jgi:phytoene dehydrogenase-like protein